MSALNGIRIVELAESVAGEYCGKLLADFGAEVIKIERPHTGSPTRAMTPSSLFAYLNTNKKSVVLDGESLDDVVATARAVIDDHTSSVGLARRHHEVVFCSITPFGIDAPAEMRNAKSINVFHASGWGYHTPSHADPALPPLKGPGRFLADYEAGLDAALCVASCLFSALHGGDGEFIDVSPRPSTSSQTNHCGRAARTCSCPTALRDSAPSWVHRGGCRTIRRGSNAALPTSASTMTTCSRDGGDPMSKALSGTVALITGASSGIGAATARALAAEGAAVALLARRADRLEELKAEIDASGGTAMTTPTDVTDAEQVAAAVAATVAELGRLDTLVNNAGLLRMGEAAQASLTEWDDLVSVNVSGVLYATHASLPHLIAAAADSPRGVADVVTISSTGGRVARPGTAVYSLTKFGVNAFSEGLRQELIGKRVRVGLVEPGTVRTEITESLPAQAKQAQKARTAGMVKLRPEDIADAVLYMVTRDRRVAVNEMLVRSAEQTW